MLELHVTERKINRGAVQVTWCVDRDTLRSFEGQPGEAFLLIVSAPIDRAYDPGAQVRKLVPLSDGTAFVGFRRPGPHHVWGMIFVGDRRRIMDRLMTRSRGTYDTDLISSETTMPRSLKDTLGSNVVVGPTARMELDVPQECFAKKPGPRLMAWATWFWSSRGDDQCDFRKRLIFAFSLQLCVLFPLSMLLRLVQAIVFLSCGITGVDYLGLFLRPLSYSMGTAFIDSETSVFWRESLPWWARVLPLGFMPAAMAVISGLTYILNYNEKTKVWAMTFKHACLWGVAVTIGLAVGLSLIAFVYQIIAGRIDAHLTALATQTPKGKVVFEEDTLTALACGNRTEESGLGNPSLSRRIVLIYEDVKAGICRPFSS